MITSTKYGSEADVMDAAAYKATHKALFAVTAAYNANKASIVALKALIHDYHVRTARRKAEKPK